MGIKIIKFVAVYLILLCSWLLWSMQPVDAAENTPGWVIQLDELSINLKHYYPYSRDPFFYGSDQMKDGLELHMNTDMLHDYVYWDNTIHSDTNYSQFHTVGWHFYLGTHVTTFLDFQYEHHSQHVLDGELPYMKYPCADSYGIVINIYRARPRGNAILGF
jgi:hypothetical protein